MRLVICCSVRHRAIIADAMRRMEARGIHAVFPNLNPPANVPSKHGLAHEHFSAMRNADAVYFILPEGRMGTSVTLELGYALALGKTAYFSQSTGDDALDCHCAAFVPLDTLAFPA